MMHINIQQVKDSFTLLTEHEMVDHWSRLHAGDQEQLPTTKGMLEAWLAFHNGDFLFAAELAANQEQSLSLQLKAMATQAHYLEFDSNKKVKQFQQVAELAEKGLVESQDEKANLYYQIAYCLGRYGQFISITKALSEGLAGKVHNALLQCIAVAPNHADAHTAMATYQAEVIGKLGKIAGKITYGVSSDEAIEFYEKGIEFAPFSISAKTEYADGLLVMFGRKQRKQAIDLYERAVLNAPIDALEALDFIIAQHELADS